MLLLPLASGLPTFNVRDFGAVGDATTDDTAAFQAAIDNATAAARDLPFEGFSLQSRAELFIPRGLYRLTRTLTLARLAPDLRGESRPVLRMDDAAQDIIFGSAVWRWQATGLHLAGGVAASDAASGEAAEERPHAERKGEQRGEQQRVQQPHARAQQKEQREHRERLRA